MTKYCTMINQEMIDTLVAKLSEWNSDWLSTYNDSNNPNVLILPNRLGAIVWEENGYYEINVGRISFTDCTIGHTYSLSKDFGPGEWDAYRETYLIGVRTGNFRIDVPLEETVVTIDESKWQYIRVMRPGKTIGNTPWFKNSEEAERWYTSSIDEFYNLIVTLADRAKAHNLSGIPSMSIKHRLTDDVGCYYFKNTNLWNKTIKWTVDQSIGIGVASLDHFVSSNIVTQEFANEWHRNASAKWNTLL